MRRSTVTVMLAFIFALVSTAAALPPGKPDVTRLDTGLREIDNATYIDANHILMFVTNHGSFGRDNTDMFGQDYGTFYPFTSIADLLSGLNNNGVLYVAGLWMGGRVDGQTRVAVAEYNDEYVPGPMAGGTYQTDNPAFRVYKLYRDSLASNPNQDYLDWPVAQGAPVNGSGEPAMTGDQMLWTVFNDADPAGHTNDAGLTAPLGVEVQQTVWASQAITGTDTALVTEPITADHVTGAGTGTIQVMVSSTEADIGRQFLIVFENDPSLGVVWVVLDGVTHQELARTPLSVTVAMVDGVMLTLSSHPGSQVTQIIETADASGPLDPPVDVMYSLNSTDDWFISSDLQNDFTRLNWRGLLGVGSWELRFTADGSQYYDWNTDNLMPNRAPFEAWNIGVDTPNDPSDDVRLNFAFLDDDASGDWSYGDRLYLIERPYVEPAPSVDQYTWPDDFRIGRIKFNDNSGLTTAPAEGTVVRFVATIQDSLSPVDTFVFSVPTYQVVTTGAQTTLVYMKYKLYNRGGNTIDDLYLSLWSDPDLGGAGDDLVGCDTLLDVFYCYNATNTDAQYGAAPPAVGFKLIHGPMVPGTYEDTAVFDGHALPGYRNLRMSAFSFYLNSTDPSNATETYNYMQGLGKFGAPLPNGTRFMAPGDPVIGIGDLDYNPADRRMMGSFGPFNFNPNDSQYVLIAFAVGQGSNRLESITKLLSALQTPPPPESVFRLKADPDPFHTYWVNALNPVSVSVVFGYSDAGDPGTPIDWSSVVFGGLPAPDSTKILASYPGFTGEVLQYYFNPHDMLASLGVVWDMTSYPVSVTGSYNGGGGFSTSADIPVQGHRSGDLNHDGDVNVADLTALVGVMFRGEPMPDPPEIADVDGQCGLTISDLTYLVLRVFGGGDEPMRCSQ